MSKIDSNFEDNNNDKDSEWSVTNELNNKERGKERKDHEDVNADIDDQNPIDDAIEVSLYSP